MAAFKLLAHPVVVLFCVIVFPWVKSPFPVLHVMDLAYC